MKDRWSRHKAQLQRAQEREARRLERQYLLVGHVTPMVHCMLIPEHCYAFCLEYKSKHAQQTSRRYLKRCKLRPLRA